MNALKQFLEFLYANWTTILVCIGLIVGIVIKTINFFNKSKEEKIEIAKNQIKEVMLKLISDAELDWEEWNKSGSIKRSQVIQKIYEQYPILNKVADQDTLVAFIDEQIDESLKTLRNVIAENKEATEQ